MDKEKRLNTLELGYIYTELACIPEEKWTMVTYLDEQGRSDALGHLGRRAGKPHPELTLKLNQTCVDHFKMLIQDINDCPDWHPLAVKKFGKYKTPKERVMTALQELMKQVN